MSTNADLSILIDYVEEKIKPLELNQIGKNDILVLLAEYDVEDLKKAIDLSFKNYICLNADSSINSESVNLFISKIGGIAHNNSLSPIDQKIRHINNYGSKAFSYWNYSVANNVLNRYIKSLRLAGWVESQILEDLNKEVMGLFAESSSWSQWKSRIENWIDDINNWDKEGESESILENQSILPSKLYVNTRGYIEQLSKQINSSYENKLYDCAAVIMRRLMEILLILSFQKNNIDKKILDKSGQKYITLEKIIKIAITESKLKLSSNTKNDMDTFRELGNLSAHKIWYNCTKKDIEPLILKYRAIIEELMYKAGIKI